MRPVKAVCCRLWNITHTAKYRNVFWYFTDRASQYIYLNINQHVGYKLCIYGYGWW